MKSLILLWMLFFSAFSYAKPHFHEYATKVEVPEPLYIDLVRSLGAEVGEWEINSLFSHTQGDFGSLEWAPEVEFVLWDGTAIEFEFPMVGRQLVNYKIAMQQRIYKNKARTHLHGLQLIYEADTEFADAEATLFYIVAHRFNTQISMIGLYGGKADLAFRHEMEVLLNHSFFYNYSQEIDFGIEMNYSSGQLSQRYFQLVPQLHLAFEGGAKIQFGFGMRDEGATVVPVGTFRLIQEFN